MLPIGYRRTGSIPGIRRPMPRVCHRERVSTDTLVGVGLLTAAASLRSACIGIAARSEQLRRIAEGDEAFVGDPERVA